MKLNDVCEVITCGVAKRPNYVEDGIPFLSSKNVKEDRFILDDFNYVSKEDYLKLTKHNKPEKGDILYTRVGSFGQAAVVDFDFDFAVFVSLTLIKPKKEILDSRYLMYYLNNPFIRNLANNSTSGIGVQNLNVKVVREFPIDLPPLETQKRIASILDNAAALRDKTQQLLTEYDQLAQSIFLDMFGDPVNNPKRLELKKLGDLGKWQSGGTPSRSIKEYYEGDFPWLSSGELNEMYTSDSKEHISELALKESSTKLVPKGSLLLGMYDTAALKSTINTRDLACNQAIAFGVLDEKLINTVYAYSIIQIGREHFRRLQRGARQKNLNLSLVKAIKILYPPIKLQNQFAEKIALIEQQKALVKQELQESEDLFNCLLQKAFKGELV